MPTPAEPRLILHAALDEPVRDLAPVHAWLCDLDDEQSHAGVDESTLAPDEQQRGARLLDPVQRRRWLHGRAAVRSVLGRLLGLPAGDVEFIANEHGKPRLQFPRACGSRPAPPLHVNWSHSANVLLLAATVSGELGVDVEVPDPTVDALAIAQTHFTRAEVDALRALAGAERIAAFYRCWTMKEAVLKALGTGLSAALGRVGVVPTAREGNLIVNLDGERITQSSPWRIFTPAFATAPATVSAIAVKLKRLP